MRSRMKKIIAIIFIPLLLLGCDYSPEKENPSERSEKRMICVESSMTTAVYVDSETGVMYFGRGAAGACVMVDEDGKPLIYKNK